LAVGDMGFQQKCIQKMRQMREQTKAIILVSHNMISLRAICSRVMFLSGGMIANDGDPNVVIPLYEKLMLKQYETSKAREEEEQGLGKIRIKAVRLLDADRNETRDFEIGQRVTVVVEYDAIERTEGAVAYAAIRLPDGFICEGTSTKLEGVTLPPLEGPGVLEVEIPELLLVPGHYVMDVVFYDQNIEYRAYFLGRKKIEFTVSSTLPSFDGMYGVFYQKQNWKVVGHREGAAKI
jgi:lipopolysaccharide transport system ATP-binding protein